MPFPLVSLAGTGLLRRDGVVDALLDALDHFGAHNGFRVNAPQMICCAADDFGAVLGLRMPRATRNQTLVLLHRNLLLLNKTKWLPGLDGST
jgi:hypothetical protein